VASEEWREKNEIRKEKELEPGGNETELVGYLLEKKGPAENDPEC